MMGVHTLPSLTSDRNTRYRDLYTDEDAPLPHLSQQAGPTRAAALLDGVIFRRIGWVARLLIAWSRNGNPVVGPVLRPVGNSLATLLAVSRTHFSIVQIGWMKTGIGMPLLSGVVAFRVLVHSRHDLTEVLACSDDTEEIIGRVAPVRLATIGSVTTWSANLWIDTSRLRPGRQKIHIRAWAGSRLAGRMRRFVVVQSEETTLSAVPDAAQSSSYVQSPGSPTDDATSWVLSQPVERHYPPGALLSGPVKSILVLRTDQLGDVAASLPAMARLRRLFPQAHVTMLLQKSNVPVARASGVADEYLDLTLRYDPKTERRYLDAEADAHLRTQLRGRSFDLAIDLSPGAESQPLLLLCSARHRVGFKPEQFPFLDFGIEVISRERINRKPIISHTAHVELLVSALGQLMDQRRETVPRREPVSPQLDSKLPIIVHSGARHPINRWPIENFLQLCGALAAASGREILFFADDHALDDAARVRCSELPGVTLMECLSMDAFDALVASAALFVANDTGPKHLAAARGVPVVSIAIPRLNWQEWGQNQGGVILSRAVPCAGCGLNNRDACGRDAACITTISVETVLKAALDIFERSKTDKEKMSPDGAKIPV
ncbi:glycosyltransferase family 9 protein [Gluconobacter sphaericus]|uniref:glycosyltransferase family 9 protein n=3 Tax=Gluconobacter sphaericus TaxID=574987 RepID=UPI001B8A983E|nr:glycosyltransferase family 9 protein [Gluconobacter sphaericus]MBS1100918.1 glycosyltransferase family 9 protein [Gluconobacter sphaericus]